MQEQMFSWYGLVESSVRATAARVSSTVADNFGSSQSRAESSWSTAPVSGGDPPPPRPGTTGPPGTASSAVLSSALTELTALSSRAIDSTTALTTSLKRKSLEFVAPPRWRDSLQSLGLLFRGLLLDVALQRWGSWSPSNDAKICFAEQSSVELGTWVDNVLTVMSFAELADCCINLWLMLKADAWKEQWTRPMQLEWLTELAKIKCCGASTGARARISSLLPSKTSKESEDGCSRSSRSARSAQQQKNENAAENEVDALVSQNFVLTDVLDSFLRVLFEMANSLQLLEDLEFRDHESRADDHESHVHDEQNEAQQEMQTSASSSTSSARRKLLYGEKLMRAKVLVNSLRPHLRGIPGHAVTLAQGTLLCEEIAFLDEDVDAPVFEPQSRSSQPPREPQELPEEEEKSSSGARSTLTTIAGDTPGSSSKYEEIMFGGNEDGGNLPRFSGGGGLRLDSLFGSAGAGARSRTSSKRSLQGRVEAGAASVVNSLSDIFTAAGEELGVALGGGATATPTETTTGTWTSSRSSGHIAGLVEDRFTSRHHRKRYRYRLVFPQGVMDNLGMGWNTLSGDEILLAFGRGVGEFELPGLIPLPPSEVEGVEADEQDLLDPSRTSPSSAPHSERTRARALELYEVACRSRAKELQDKKLRPITVHNATGAMQLKVAVFSRTDQLCLLPLTSCVLDPTRRAFLRLDGEEFQLRVYKLDSVLMDRCIYSVAGIRRGQTVNLRSNDCEVVKEGFYTGDQGAGATSGREQDEEVDHLRWK